MDSLLKEKIRTHRLICGGSDFSCFVKVTGLDLRCSGKNTSLTRNLFGELAVGGVLTLNRLKIKFFLSSKFEPQYTKKKDTSKLDSVCL